MKTKLLLSSVAACAVVGMVGCGGGGSSSTSVEESKLSGVAVDDLILNGIVEATTMDGTSLATGRTSATDGSYALNLNYAGVAMIQVRCDENSTMLNPETQEKTECPTNMALRSMADVEAGVEQTVNISPLTEVVVARAEALVEEGQTVSSQELETARAEIGTMFGVDPLADNPTEGEYATIVGAIQEIADSTPGTSVLEVTENLADALEDGKAEAEDEPVVAALTAAMDDANITNNLTDTNGTYTPPENIAPMTDIDAAKAFMAEVRTQTTSASDFVNAEEVAVNEALNNTVMNIEEMTNTLDMIVTNIGDMIENEATEVTVNGYTITKEAEGEYSYSMTDNTTTWSGNLQFPTVIAGEDAEAELYKDQTLKIHVDGTFPLADEEALNNGATNLQSLVANLETTHAGTNTNIKLSGIVSSNGTSYAIKELDADLGYHEVTDEDDSNNTEPELDYLKLNTLNLEGVIGDYTIDGVLTVNAYAQNSALAEKGGIEESTGFYAAISCDNGDLQNPTLTATLNDVTYNGEKEYSEDSYAGFEFNDIPGDFDWDDIRDNLATSSTCSDENTSVDIDLYHTWSDEEIANSGYLPSDTTFVGTVKRENALLEGTLNAKWTNIETMDLSEDSEDTPLVEVAFNGTLQMPERPEMLTTLTFKNSVVDGNISNALTASYSYDATVINASATMDEDMENGTVEITTQTGLKAALTLKDELIDSSSTLTKDGKLLGTFEYRDDAPVIKYTDGNFETLF